MTYEIVKNNRPNGSGRYDILKDGEVWEGGFFDKAKAEDYLLGQYREMVAESRTCGYEYPSFDEWLNPRLTRERAEQRMQARSAEQWDDPDYWD